MVLGNCSTDPNACQQICHNNDDSLNCSCYPGYRLAADERTCEGIIVITLLLRHCSDLFMF